MKIPKILKIPATYSMIVSMLFFSFQAPVMADIVGTQELAMQVELQLQRDDVRDLMARDDVRDALLGYGVTQADVDTRIDNLTSSELLKIQNQLGDLPAGADALSAVLTVLLILILLDVLGVTDIFPRI